jgi:hypothetical protein
MDASESEVHYFRYVRKVDGSLEPVDVARRNGRVVPRFHPSVLEPPETTDPEETPEYQELVSEISQNLNPTEKGTWLRLLDGASICDIASDARVSRAAIYDRIKRMVAKNDYVAIWWRLKNKVNQYA